eukprot:scaffold32743_cov67-Skeletonema_dohrnii-CCMP3373.AAC.1
MDNIDVDDFFNLDLESIFEEGSWDDLNLSSSPPGGHFSNSNSSIPELTGIGSGRNADNAGGVAPFSTTPLLSATPRPGGDINGPQLVSTSTCTSIYRSQDTGIK